VTSQTTSLYASVTSVEMTVLPTMTQQVTSQVIPRPRVTRVPREWKLSHANWRRKTCGRSSMSSELKW